MNLNSLPVTIRRLVPEAALPGNYERAKRAISECKEIDECKDWSDRASALASYARQARDTSMRDAALRIMIRAEDRVGELLNEIPRRRMEIAKQHGISHPRASRAMAIARVERAVKEPLIEHSPPISADRLATLGKNPRTYYGPKGNAVNFCSYLATIVEWVERHDPAELARSLDRKDVRFIRTRMRKIEEWADKLEHHLPE